MAARAGVDPVDFWERYTLRDVFILIDAWWQNRREFRLLIAGMTAHVVNVWGAKPPATPESLLGEKSAKVINNELLARALDRQAKPQVQQPSSRKKRAQERERRSRAGILKPGAPPPPSSSPRAGPVESEGEAPIVRRRKSDLDPEELAALKARKEAWRRSGGRVG